MKLETGVRAGMLVFNHRMGVYQKVVAAVDVNRDKELLRSTKDLRVLQA